MNVKIQVTLYRFIRKLYRKFNRFRKIIQKYVFLCTFILLYIFHFKISLNNCTKYLSASYKLTTSYNIYTLIHKKTNLIVQNNCTCFKYECFNYYYNTFGVEHDTRITAATQWQRKIILKWIIKTIESEYGYSFNIVFNYISYTIIIIYLLSSILT